MIEIPRNGDTPLIKLFQSLKELQTHTGETTFHGIFDANQNMILATIDSVAHEIGHYKDFRSGKLKNVSDIQDAQLRISARMRNEIVAILFASSRAGDGGTSIDYEIDFISWLDFQRSREKNFGPSSSKKLSDLKFNEIQELADWLSIPTQIWFKKLQLIFKNYLNNERELMTYGRARL
ncbi:MAG: hypothetical protein J0L93_02010 [Deltaproteobacteria bacterium]|nr:hypothetical protein [Deltaproteobacteria bacterium]